jgi:hypothetical protein
MDDDYSLIAEVREVTTQGARLAVSGQEVFWPAGNLPQGIKAGDTLTLRLLTPAMAEQEQHERARAILTEILGGQS